MKGLRREGKMTFFVIFEKKFFRFFKNSFDHTFVFFPKNSNPQKVKKADFTLPP